MDIIEKATDTLEREDTAEYMAELLMDENVSTWKMFEQLAFRYLEATEDEKKGIDFAISTLTGWDLKTISEQMLERYAA